MSASEQTPEASRSTRLASGLATLALLKANFDSGRDHIDMLLPFVLDCVAAQSSDDFTGDAIRAALVARHGLQVPSAALGIILSRAVHRRAVRREGGRYFRVPGMQSSAPDIPAERNKIHGQLTEMAIALREFVTSAGLAAATDDDALALFFEFLNAFHVWLLLESSVSDGGSALLQNELKGVGSTEMRIVARFVLERALPDRRLRDILQRCLEGFVLQNALFLRDISTVRKRFTDLTVYFDTGFLLSALGLTGEVAGVVARECLDLLRATNASLAVFETTVSEIKRILSVYERHLSSSSGIATLHATSLTRYMLTHRVSPSDVRQMIALLETDLRGLGMSIEPLPRHDPRYTLDETDLAQRVRKPDQTDLDPRVMHDVDCVAAVLTLRAGHASASYDDAKAVFATTTGLLVKNVGEWYRQQGEAGLPPVIHHLALSSIAWLKRPESAAKLKLSELVALCSATLAPSRQTWDLFLTHLRRLRDSDEITSDEMVAVIVSELTDSLLMRFEDEVEPDATTLTEVVERVRQSYQSDALARVAEAERKAAQEIASALSAKAKVEEQLKRKEEEQRNLLLKLRAKAARIARIVGRSFFVVVAVILVAGPPALGWFVGPSGTPIPEWIVYVVAGAVWLAGILGLLWGGHVDQWRKVVETAVDLALRRWLGVANSGKALE